jgi:hypothetical protein
MEQLNLKHFEIVSEYIEQTKASSAKHYMMTIARDGESPARSIYFYDNAVDAAAGYGAYTDWGFAKDFLTISLYEPTGIIHTKTLKRPRGGECTFVRDDYNRISQILMETKSHLNADPYNNLVLGFAKLLSKDNQRFDQERFFKNTEYTGKTDE